MAFLRSAHSIGARTVLLQREYLCFIGPAASTPLPEREQPFIGYGIVAEFKRRRVGNGTV
jgi:hypothetical protein